SARSSFELLEGRRMFNVAATAANVPVLSSDSSAHAKLYLDFAGDPASTWNGYNVPVTPAYDADSDPTTFSTTELSNIREIWARVSEAFSMFNLDVSTV